MAQKKMFSAVALAVAGALTAGAAGATDGYFSHGYGMKAKGRGGASTAMTTDTFGGANNPATMVWVGNRIIGPSGVAGGDRIAVGHGTGIVVTARIGQACRVVFAAEWNDAIAVGVKFGDVKAEDDLRVGAAWAARHAGKGYG